MQFNILKISKLDIECFSVDTYIYIYTHIYKRRDKGYDINREKNL